MHESLHKTADMLWDGPLALPSEEPRQIEAIEVVLVHHDVPSQGGLTPATGDKSSFVDSLRPFLSKYHSSLEHLLSGTARGIFL